MAKALLGYAVTARQHNQHINYSRLTLENRQLRQRIADLESALATAHVENEALSALVSHDSSALAGVNR